MNEEYDPSQFQLEKWISDKTEQYSHLSDKSKEQYLDKYKSMIERNTYPEDISNTKKSFETNRAAFVFGVFHSLTEGKTNKKDRDMLIKEVAPYVDGTKIWSEFSKEKKDKSGSTSKKALHNLPKEWKQVMFTNASDRVKKSLAIMELTGARPVAFEGTGISVKKEDDILTFTFKPGKRDEHLAKGHDYIRLKLKINEKNPRAVWLSNLVDKSPHKQLQIADDEVSNLVFKVSEKSFPRRSKPKSRPSAYSYRHEAMTRFRLAGLR